MAEGSGGDCYVSVTPYTSCKLEWQIKNFCLSFRDDSYTISSPEFTLEMKDSAKWRMIIEVRKRRSGNHRIHPFLKRLPVLRPGPRVIFVDLEGTIIIGEETYSSFNLLKKSFEENSAAELKLSHTINVINQFLPFMSDTLRIKLHVIASKEQSVQSVKPFRPEIKCLSRCLKELLSSKHLSDVVLKIGRKRIKAHKSILSRNEVLENYINVAEDGVINLQGLDSVAVEGFVEYLYSGDADTLLHKLTIDMVKCLEHFRCDTLKYLYATEELNMYSTIDNETEEFHWVINEVNRRILEEPDFSISSPWFKSLNILRVKWKLKISKNPETANISIFAEMGDNKPPYFCLDFGIENQAGRIFFDRRIIRYRTSDPDECYERMGFENFITEELIRDESLVVDDTLRIFFKARTSDGSQTCSMGCRMLSLTTTEEEASYDILSSEMAELLKNKKFSDITLKSEDKEFRAHICVLRARSEGFRRKIEGMSSGTKTLTLEKLKPDMLEGILHYLYSGVLKDDKPPNLLQLYVASEIFEISSLKEEIGSLLETKHDIYVEKAADALSKAEERGYSTVARTIKDLMS